MDAVVDSVQLSLNSELAVLAGLSEAAARRGRVHDVIVMVDLGDLREGVWPDALVPFVRDLVSLPGVRLVGLGANLTCYGGVLPSEENMGRLVAYVEAAEQMRIVKSRTRYDLFVCLFTIRKPIRSKVGVNDNSIALHHTLADIAHRVFYRERSHIVGHARVNLGKLPHAFRGLARQEHQM